MFVCAPRNVTAVPFGDLHGGYSCAFAIRCQRRALKASVRVGRRNPYISVAGIEPRGMIAVYSRALLHELFHVSQLV